MKWPLKVRVIHHLSLFIEACNVLGLVRNMTLFSNINVKPWKLQYLQHINDADMIVLHRPLM